MLWLIVLLGGRIGEASHPGPFDVGFDDPEGPDDLWDDVTDDELPLLIDADCETDREEGGAYGCDDLQGDDNVTPSAAETVEDLQEFQIFATPRCDVPFDLMQLGKWRDIERSLGIKDPKGPPRKAESAPCRRFPSSCRAVRT